MYAPFGTKSHCCNCKDSFVVVLNHCRMQSVCTFLALEHLIALLLILTKFWGMLEVAFELLKGECFVNINSAVNSYDQTCSSFPSYIQLYMCTSMPLNMGVLIVKKVLLLL